MNISRLMKLVAMGLLASSCVAAPSEAGKTCPAQKAQPPGTSTQNTAAANTRPAGTQVAAVVTDPVTTPVRSDHRVQIGGLD
jgi:hypothetical protein